MDARGPVKEIRLLLVVVLLAAPAGAGAQTVLPPAGQAAVSALPPVADAERLPFSEWLGALRQEAIAKGVKQETVQKALTGIQPIPVVVERDRTQAERTLPLDKYLERRLDRKTLRTARTMAKRHASLLARVSKRYGVPSGVIVAVWGLESNFGRFSGVRPTVASLVTLAYDNRRAALFREELFNALRILDRGDIDLDRMKGSWAGAMGQPQFMPSSYLRFAQDFDEDGRTDIWRSQADVFASIANFLKQEGWQAGAGWGRSVKVPAVLSAKIGEAAPLRGEGCEATRELSEALPWSRWKALGVRVEGPLEPPAPRTPASLLRAGGRDFLVFDNYHALLEYNCAHAYALSVAVLSDRIRGVNSVPVRATARPKAKPAKKAPAKKAPAKKAVAKKAPAKKAPAKKLP
jgi:membrane-bound lytic murein transglycosylase B